MFHVLFLKKQTYDLGHCRQRGDLGSPKHQTEGGGELWRVCNRGHRGGHGSLGLSWTEARGPTVANQWTWAASEEGLILGQGSVLLPRAIPGDSVKHQDSTSRSWRNESSSWRGTWAPGWFTPGSTSREMEVKLTPATSRQIWFRPPAWSESGASPAFLSHLHLDCSLSPIAKVKPCQCCTVPLQPPLSLCTTLQGITLLTLEGAVHIVGHVDSRPDVVQLTDHTAVWGDPIDLGPLIRSVGRAAPVLKNAPI